MKYSAEHMSIGVWKTRGNIASWPLNFFQPFVFGSCDGQRMEEGVAVYTLSMLIFGTHANSSLRKRRISQKIGIFFRHVFTTEFMC